MLIQIQIQFQNAFTRLFLCGEFGIFNLGVIMHIGTIVNSPLYVTSKRIITISG